MDELWRNGPGRFRLSQGEIEFHCWGPPPQAADTIVLLHEGLGCIDLWRDFPETLAQTTGFGVLAYSRFGYGRSDTVQLPRPLDYMTREAGVLAEVIECFGLRRFFLVGHSDGGSIAAIYAGDTARPGLAGLVLLAAHFFVEPVCVQAIETARDQFINGDLRQRLARYHTDVDTAFLGWSGAWLDPRFIEGWNIEGSIPAMCTPTLVLQGLEDPYGTMEQYRGFGTDVEIYELPGCGHNPVREAPEMTLKLLSGFYTRHKKAPS